MLEIIERILNIEAAADEVVCGARAAKESFDADVSQEIDSLRDDIKKRSDSRIEKLKSFEDGEADDMVAKIAVDAKAAEERLDKIYTDNAEEWISRVFGNVTGV